MMQDSKSDCDTESSTSKLRHRIKQLEQSNDQLSQSNRQVQARVQRLQNLLNTIPGMVYEGGPDWSNKFISQSERVCGYTSEELLSQEFTWLDVVHPADREKVRLESTRLDHGSTSITQRYRIRHKNGEIRWVEDHKASIFDKNGAFAGVDGIVFDITESMATEQAFSESEARFRSFFENAADGFLVADVSTGQFSMANPALCQMTGYSHEDILKLSVPDIHPEEAVADVLDTFEKQAKGEVPLAHDIPVKAQNGSVIYCDINAIPIVRDGKKFVLGVFRNVTEKRVLSEQLEEFRAHMTRTERLASLGTLSATVAHELNQPLTVLQLTIQTCLAELEENETSQQIVTDLKECLQEVSVASSIVNRFREFAKHSRSHDLTLICLIQIAQKVVRVWTEHAKKSGLSLVIIGLECLPKVHMNEIDAEQIFFSLIENAIQAADPEKVQQLLITATTEDASIELIFTDNCGGIAPEDIDHIFNPFFTTKMGQRGTGLGLCIVANAVQGAGGKITVDNRPGEGVTFCITLPVTNAKNFRSGPEEF